MKIILNWQKIEIDKRWNIETPEIIKWTNEWKFISFNQKIRKRFLAEYRKALSEYKRTLSESN